jgi:hypothetical protein
MSGEALENVERTGLTVSTRSTAFAAADFGARQNKRTLESGSYKTQKSPSQVMSLMMPNLGMTAVLKHVKIRRPRKTIPRHNAGL